MNRRDVLTCLGASAGIPAMTGCVGDDDGVDESSPADDTDASGWAEAPDIVNLQATSDGDLDLEVTVRNHGTFSRPPVLSVTFTARADDRRAYGPFAGHPVPFNDVQLEPNDGATTLRLIRFEERREVGDCWVPEALERPTQYVDLESGESRTEPLAIVLDGDRDVADELAEQPDCYALGTYHTGTTVDVLDPGFDPQTDARDDQLHSESTLELVLELA